MITEIISSRDILLRHKMNDQGIGKVQCSVAIKSMIRVTNNKICPIDSKSRSSYNLATEARTSQIIF